MRLTGVLRVAGAVLAGAVLLAAFDYYQGDIVAWVEALRSPLNTAPLPLGDPILRDREVQQLQRVSREYGRVKAALDAAKGKGLDVSRLEPLLGESLRLAKERRFERSLTLLNRIEMSIPRPQQKVVPVHDSDPLPEEPALRTAPARKRARRKA